MRRVAARRVLFGRVPGEQLIPSLAKIAKKLKMTEEEAQAAIQQAMDRGLISGTPELERQDSASL